MIAWQYLIMVKAVSNFPTSSHDNGKSHTPSWYTPTQASILYGIVGVALILSNFSLQITGSSGHQNQFNSVIYSIQYAVLPCCMPRIGFFWYVQIKANALHFFLFPFVFACLQFCSSRQNRPIQCSMVTIRTGKCKTYSDTGH